MLVKADIWPEEARRFLADRAGGGEVCKRSRGLVRRIERQHGHEHVLHVALDAPIADVDEAFDVLAIFLDDVIAQSENVECHVTLLYRQAAAAKRALTSNLTLTAAKAM